MSPLFNRLARKKNNTMEKASTGRAKGLEEILLLLFLEISSIPTVLPVFCVCNKV